MITQADRFHTRFEYDLTIREYEVYRLIRARKQNKEIAQALGISVRTVKHHVGQVLLKTGAKSRYMITSERFTDELKRIKRSQIKKRGL